ncbi:beta-ketoacyl-[acyl-carrier-protein] synthase II [Candidatus Aerophobetes bacterium]|uniref:3-oxoacyl-[acyl-carrier-protein] synthase 2 n=1 Tax=Aerophobetes bacterium TaxID=2030807 RepID=A0A2A4YDL7_UNCAE|nr:MAG: beta-ketoacyl-[acyl-carrier-protein] synthase II [Candidatus Aerophobetes bacterium]
MKKRRVVVTGMGVVSCFGMDVDEFYANLLEGKSGVREIDQFDCSEYPTRFAATVLGFDPEGYIDRKQARRVDPFTAYAMVAGKKALENADLYDKLDTLNKDKAGIIIGSGMGGMKVYSDGVTTIREKGFKRLTPFFVPFIITNMAGGLLAIDVGFRGPNYSVSTACATATHSIVLAADHIRKGDADIMLAGGAESAINTTGLAGFVACKALSTRNDDIKKASRPWDKNRDGFVIGEGAAVLVLEELEHAEKRGATILAEYLGGSTTCDAHHMTDPVADGSVVAMTIEKALKDADLKPSDIQYINAHATSTSVGDMCEIRAIKKVFSGHEKNIKINSTKSMIGHCLGAAGGMEAIATIKAIQTGELHPTINLDNPEEELGDFDPVAHKKQKFDVTNAVNNSFGFGGHNATTIFGKFTG